MTGGCQARGEVDEVEVGLGVEQMLQKEKSNETCIRATCFGESCMKLQLAGPPRKNFRSSFPPHEKLHFSQRRWSVIRVARLSSPT
jgi:hypothetical protein